MILPATAPAANTNFLGVGAIAGNIITLAWKTRLLVERLSGNEAAAPSLR